MPRATRSSARKSKPQEPEVTKDAPETSSADEPMEDSEGQAVNGVAEVSTDEKQPAAEETSEDETVAETIPEQETAVEETPEKETAAEETSENEAGDEDPAGEVSPLQNGDAELEKPEKDAAKEGVANGDETKPTENGAESAGDVEMKEDAVPEPQAPEVFVDRDRRLLAKKPSHPSEKLTELEKYWKPIKDDPSDFTGWTYLLQYVDAGEDIAAGEEVYKEFLARYPYCYGYWKKYADFLKKRSTIEEAERAFEEGVRAIPLSVDLWLHYINHMRSTHEKEGGDEEKVRQVFDRASRACGLDYRSFKLWEAYLKWELEKGQHANVMTVYDRLLKVPTAQHQTFFDAMKEFVNEHNPKDFLQVDEFISLRTEVLAEFRAANGAEAETPVAVSTGDDPPGDDAPPGDIEKEEVVIKSDEETKAIREKIIANRTEVYSKLETEIKKRHIFEDALKRPYFHVKPLEKGQLKTWREYLDFEIKEGDRERIRVLFERCFIACALYEEFWLKYVEYLRSINAPADEISAVFRRTCTVHLRKRLSINLQWSIFEEHQHKYDNAMEILDNVEDYFGTCLPVATRKIGLARRAKKVDEVENLYSHYVEIFRKRGDSNQADAIIVKRSRYVDKVLKDRKRAESIIEEALEKSPENPRLYMAMVDILLDEGPERNDAILEVFSKALNANLPSEVKLLFAHRKMEYLEDFGDDVSQCERAYDEYATFVKKTKEDRKRTVSSEEGLEYDEGSAAKKPRLSKPPTPTSAGNNISVRTTAPAPTAAAAPAAAATYPSAYPAAYSGTAPAAAAAAPTATGYSQAYPSYPYGYQQSGWGGYGSSAGGGAAAAAPHYPAYSNQSYNYNYYGQR